MNTKKKKKISEHCHIMAEIITCADNRQETKKKKKKKRGGGVRNKEFFFMKIRGNKMRE